jgi:hypothetical protein
MDCFVASFLAMTVVKAAHPGAGEYDAASGAGDPVLAIRFETQYSIGDGGPICRKKGLP